MVIVGGGFGGMRAAQALRGLPVRVTMIDRRNYHLFQPLLYQVATAGLSPTDIAYPIRAIFRGQRNFDFRMSEVTGVDLEARRVRGDGQSIPYDYLILAVGSTNHYFGLDSVARCALPLKTLDDAVTIRNHLLTQFERTTCESDMDPALRRAMLTFVIAGGGPTGVELAGAISELIRLVLVKDYRAIDARDVRVILLEALDDVLLSYPETLRQATVQTLRNKGVDVRLGAAVESFDGRRVRLKGGETIDAGTLFWTAGVRAVDLAHALGAATDQQGRVRVEPSLSLPGHPEVFVIGDAASLDVDGQPAPMVAPTAIQMGELAARNVGRSLLGREPMPFVYKDPGSLATIGRNAAVAHVYGLKFKGFVAWAVWLVVHIVQLIGFRNRLIVLINWAWDYLFYDRGTRLITRN